MFERADCTLAPFARLRKSARKKPLQFPDTSLLISSPGRDNPLKKILCSDFDSASHIQIMSAYFLPARMLRRALLRAARRGAQIQLILPGKSDVPLFIPAVRSFYPQWLRAGIEAHEYQPQILHAKLIVADDIVYAGSANLDSRSLSINYELTLRLRNPKLADQARAIFAGDLPLCRRMDWTCPEVTRGFWRRLQGRLAFFILARLDPSIARYQWRGILARLKR
jgi:cardiolipin synthase